MNRQTAEKVSPLLEQAIVLIDEAIQVALTTESAPDVKKFATSAARAIAALSDEILKPLYGEYDDLMPAFLRAALVEEAKQKKP